MSLCRIDLFDVFILSVIRFVFFFHKKITVKKKRAN